MAFVAIFVRPWAVAAGSHRVLASVAATEHQVFPRGHESFARGRLSLVGFVALQWPAVYIQGQNWRRN